MQRVLWQHIRLTARGACQIRHLTGSSIPVRSQGRHLRIRDKPLTDHFAWRALSQRSGENASGRPAEPSEPKEPADASQPRVAPAEQTELSSQRFELNQKLLTHLEVQTSLLERLVSRLEHLEKGRSGLRSWLPQGARRLRWGLFALLLLVTLSSCNFNWFEIPHSGRTRRIALSEVYGRSMKLPQDMEPFGLKQLPDDSYRTVRVQKLMDKITKACGAPKHHVHVLLGDQMPLAGALPSNHMYIATGMLKLCKTEDELVGIMSHEVAHNVAQHVLEQFGRTAFLLSFAPLVGVLPMFLLSTVWSRVRAQKNEYEADRMAVMFAAQAGFRPEALINVFGKIVELEKAGKAPKPAGIHAFWSHPPTIRRIERMKKLVPGAVEKFPPLPVEQRQPASQRLEQYVTSKWQEWRPGPKTEEPPRASKQTEQPSELPNGSTKESM